MERRLLKRTDGGDPFCPHEKRTAAGRRGRQSFESCVDCGARLIFVDGNPDLSCPEGLSDDGRKAHAKIVEVLTACELTYTGGCRAFYTPAEWRERGEKYGGESELIVVYDGGDLRHFFNLDTDMETGYVFITKMHEALEAIGFRSEECTGWYCAIYRNDS